MDKEGRGVEVLGTLAFVAPKLAGPKGIPWFTGRSASRMQQALKLGSFRLGPGAEPDAALIIERAPLPPV